MAQSRTRKQTRRKICWEPQGIQDAPSSTIHCFLFDFSSFICLLSIRASLLSFSSSSLLRFEIGARRMQKRRMRGGKWQVGIRAVRRPHRLPPPFSDCSTLSCFNGWFVIYLLLLCSPSEEVFLRRSRSTHQETSKDSQRHVGLGHSILLAGFTENMDEEERESNVRVGRENRLQAGFISFSTGRTMSPFSDSFIFRPFCKPFVLRTRCTCPEFLRSYPPFNPLTLIGLYERKTSSFRGSSFIAQTTRSLDDSSRTRFAYSTRSFVSPWQNVRRIVRG